MQVVSALQGGLAATARMGGLGDSPDYAAGRVYGPIGYPTASFPTSGMFVSLSDFQKWQREVMTQNEQRNAAALTAAYASVGVQQPAVVAPAPVLVRVMDGGVSQPVQPTINIPHAVVSHGSPASAGAAGAAVDYPVNGESENSSLYIAVALGLAAWLFSR